jgi:hypothetical protein
MNGWKGRFDAAVDTHLKVRTFLLRRHFSGLTK